LLGCDYAIVELCRQDLRAKLAEFMPLDLDYPGLKVLCADPPIFSIDDFMTEEECEGIIQGAAGFTIPHCMILHISVTYHEMVAL